MRKQTREAKLRNRLLTPLIITSLISAHLDPQTATAAPGCSGIGAPCPDHGDPDVCTQCPCPPGSGGSGGGGGGGSYGWGGGAPPPGCHSLVCVVAASPGMPTYWVSEPFINLRIEDEPLGYSGQRGPRVSWHLSYRQRGAVLDSNHFFGVGTNWTCSLRAYLVDLGTTPDVVRVHRGGAGYIDYNVGLPQYRDGSIVTNITGGYQIEHLDGSKETFTTSFADGAYIYYFLTTQADPAGNALTFSYSGGTTNILLTNVTDPDGRATQFYYENASLPTQITKVVDPFSRTNTLKYDSSGYITNIVDVAGLSTSFAYDAGNPGWITNMTTPYGSTAFTYGGVDVTSQHFSTGGNLINRFVKVALPTGGNELYLFRQDCSGFMTNSYSPFPSTSPLTNTLDNVDQQNRNSFHWSPLQYKFLSTNNPSYLTPSDYAIGRLQHWLADPNLNNPDATCTLSLARVPSPDTNTVGQVVWYDYDGKSAGNNNYIGTNAQPSLLALVLPDGTTRYTHYSHGAHGQLTQTIATYSKPDTSIGLRTNTYYYAANNVDLQRWVGPNNEQVISNYFSAGNVYHQPDISYDALNQSTTYTYNANRLVTRVVSPATLTTTNIYFSSGTYANWLSTSIDLEISRTNSYTYANGLVYSHTDERGLTTTNTWDNLQRLTSTTFPDGTTLSNQYLNLDLSAVKGRNGWWARYAYNNGRQKIFETNANGVVTAYGYCTCGALTSMTNDLGGSVQQVTAYDYNYQGSLTFVYLPDATITNAYNALGQKLWTSIGWGYKTNTYNNQGLLTSVLDAYGAEQATTFDIEDRPIYTTDANGVTLTNTYDLLGRLATRTYPDAGVESFGYSARGLTAYTNQLNLASSHGYDAGARKTSETNANNESLSYTYNAAGDLLSLTDAKLQTTQWKYDQYGRVTNKLDQASTVVLKYTYDPDSRLTNRWSIAKGNTVYTYDPVGNLTNIAYPSSGTVRFTYDDLNRMSGMFDVAGTTLYNYTVGGQLWTEDGPFATDTVTNTYQNRLRTKLVLAQPSLTWTNAFGYDAVGRLTNITSQAGSFAYTLGATAPASSLIKNLLLPNTSYITNTFDSVARLTGTWLKNSGNTTLDSATYGYNSASQRTTFTNAAGTYYQYRYDNIGQLKVADSSVNSEDRGYKYDAAWNLNWLTNNGSASQFQVNSLNELTNWSAGACYYDGNGNLTNKAISGSQNLIFTYDDENRLVGIDNAVAGSSTVFTYDGLGRLRIRQEYLTAASPFLGSGAPASEIHYIYDGFRVIQERDTNNIPQISYTRGPDLSGTLEGAGGIGGPLARSDGYSSGNWTTNNFYHADGNGNITYLVNSTQTLAASYRYDPFGNTISSSGSLAGANVYRFSSKEIHVNSGFYYYLYRFYDPALQRWVNGDPLGDRGTLFSRNRPRTQQTTLESAAYVFCKNSPPNFIDSLGLELPSPDLGNPPWVNGELTLDPSCTQPIWQINDDDKKHPWQWVSFGTGGRPGVDGIGWRGPDGQPHGWKISNGNSCKLHCDAQGYPTGEPDCKPRSVLCPKAPRPWTPGGGPPDNLPPLPTAI